MCSFPVPESRSLATELVSPSGCLRPARVLVHAHAPPSTYIPLACNRARVFFGLSAYFKTIVPLSILPARPRSYSRIFVFCFRPARARSRSCLRRVVSLPPSVRALVSSSAGGPLARIRALASPSPSRMHVYPSVCGPLARNRALASLSGNGVSRFPERISLPLSEPPFGRLFEVGS